MSTQTINDFLHVASNYLPKPLITTEALQRIQSLAAKLPPAPLIIFESHIGSPVPDLDFLLCVDPDWVTHPQIQQFTTAHYGWSEIQQYSQKWVNASEKSWFKKGIDSLWLEFDTSKKDQPLTVPGIFFPSLEVCVFNVSYTDHIQAVEEALTQLPRLGTNPDIRKTLHHCLNVMPTSARVYALGDMNGRSSNILRVAIANIPVQALKKFLLDIAWQGDTNFIDNLISQIAPSAQTISIDLDIGTTIGTKLGLEFTHPNRFNHQWWQTILNNLTDLGLCQTEKRDALLQWQGHSNETQNAQIWPNNLLETTHLQLPILCFMARFINHVKVVYQPGLPLTAKAYIAMRQICTDKAHLKKQH